VLGEDLRAQDTSNRAIVIVAGLFFVIMMSLDTADQWLKGANDFAPLYVGAQLVGTGDLYTPEPYYGFLRQRFGGINESLRYTRPPHHALMFWPLGRLPYDTAHLVWTLLRAAAVAGFLLLWRRPSRRDAMMFTALSLPLGISFCNGQDTPFLLLWIALALHWQGKGRPFLAGLAFSLCAAKFHLFVLLPLLFFGQRRWRMTAGLATGAAALLAVSFAVAGAAWPVEYFATLTDGRVHPAIDQMPNLHGVFGGLPHAALLEIIAGLAVVAGAWHVVRRSSFEIGLATVLAGGVLLSYHAYRADCLVLLPAALLVLAANPSHSARVLGTVLLTPLVYTGMKGSLAGAYLTAATILLFFGALVVSVGREELAARREPSAPEFEPA
jgi:Glycosyltransferase family 87